MSEKSTISERDFNWNVHLAGLRAEAKAKQEGGTDPEAAAALLDAGSGKQMIAGHGFPPITAGFILLLPMLHKVAASHDVLCSESGTVMMMAWALAYPQEAWEVTKAAKREGADVLAEAVFAFASGFRLEALREVAAWVTKELERLKDDAEEAEVTPGKSGSQASASPATPAPSPSEATTTAATAGC